MTLFRHNLKFFILILFALILVCAVAYVKISVGINELNVIFSQSIAHQVNTHQGIIEMQLEQMANTAADLTRLRPSLMDEIEHLTDATSLHETLNVYCAAKKYISVSLIDVNGKCIASTASPQQASIFENEPYLKNILHGQPFCQFEQDATTVLFYGSPFITSHNRYVGMAVIEVQAEYLLEYLEDEHHDQSLNLMALMTRTGNMLACTYKNTFQDDDNDRIMSFFDFGFTDISPSDWYVDNTIIAHSNGSPYTLLFRRLGNTELVLLHCYPYPAAKSLPHEAYSMIGSLIVLFIVLITFIFIMGSGVIRNERDYMKVLSSYHSVFSTDGSGIIIFDQKGVCQHVDNTACSLLNLDKDTLMHQSVYSIFRKLLVSEADQGASENGPLPLLESDEITLTTSEGNEIDISLQGMQLDRNNYVLLIKNITRRKSAERALQQSEQKLQEILNFLPDPTFVINKKREIIIWNKGMQLISGYNAEDVLDKGNYEYSFAVYGTREPALIDCLFEEDLAYLSRYENIRYIADTISAETKITIAGKTKNYLLNVAPLKDSSGTVVGAIEILKDITQLKTSEKQLRKYAQRLKKTYLKLKQSQHYLIQSSKMSAVGTLASGIAHEFNNIFTVITGYADLASQASSDTFVANALTNVKEASKRAKNITESLREFSCSNDNRKKITDIKDSIERCLMLWHQRIEEQQIRIETDLAQTPPIMCNPNKLLHIFSNLFSNALDAMQNIPNGKLSVKLSYITKAEFKKSFKNISISMVDTEFIVINVADNGHGIAESHQARIFEPFYTSKGVLVNGDRNAPGTGMGLSIVYGIVKELHGEIFVSSKHSEGAEFIIALPAPRNRSIQT